jgi:predicted PurR-regulated permease PerM
LNRRLEKNRLLKDGRSDSVASLLVTLGTLFLICIPFLVIGVGLFLQLGGVSTQLDSDAVTLESILARADEIVKPLAEKVGADTFKVSNYVQEHKAELLQGLRQPVQKFAGQAGFTLLTLIFALLTQFFMLRDAHRLVRPAVELSPLPEGRTREVLTKVVATVKAVFVGTVLVAIIQGAVIGITYGFVGVSNALLLGVVSAILCIIPLLGAPVIYIPVGLFLLSQGKTTEALIVLGVGFIIVSQIDNVIKPFLIGNQVNLHPMAIFFAILGGIIVFGPIGVMAGPMLLTILIALQDVVRQARSRDGANGSGQIADVEPDFGNAS